MKYLTSLLFFLSLSISFGQKGTTNFPANDALFFNTISRQPNAPFISVQNVLQQIKSAASYGENITFEKTQQINSKVLTHYRYNIYKDGKRIFAAQVHFSVSLDNNHTRLIEYPLMNTNSREQNFPPLSDAEEIKAKIGAQYIENAEQVWINRDNQLLAPALLVDLSGPETLHREVIYFHNEIISQEDLNKYVAGPGDTTVSVKVFEPDPLTKAQVSYGTPYKDYNDSDVVQVNNQQVIRQSIFTFKNDTIYPENDYAKITDFSPPNIAPVTSVTPQFYFGRNNDGFEDVNALYHITKQKQHLIDLGYPSLPSYQIQVDAHAIGGSDQSFFSSANTPHRLYFGEGGVDDAEDDDVIIHEFTHSVVYEASPSNSVSTERACIEEALCDYFAVSHSRMYSNYNKDSVFNWDGHNEFWPGRAVISTKNYSDVSFSGGNYYEHTDLFASALFSIYDNLGRNKTDELALEAIFNLGPSTTMPELAGYFILSDSALYKGAEFNSIYNAFSDRGIFAVISLPENKLSQLANIHLLSTYEFAKGGALTISSPDQKLASFKIYSANGQLMDEQVISSATSHEVRYSSEKLSPGVYILQVTTLNGAVRNFKVSKF